MGKTDVMLEFEGICAVPRCSFHNEKILAYCVNWASEHSLPCFLDAENGNVVISAPATPGYEDKPGIALQGHLDMVPVCDPGVTHDFTSDPIDVYIENGFYKARGTTLGADDGVAAAIGFAVLSDKSLPHPALELFLTTDEEVGMGSVAEADLGYLKSESMINLDCGPEDNFVIGCCGGAGVNICIENKREAFPGNVMEIEIGGLAGGHSGIEIGDEHGNALKIMGAVLYRLRKTDYRIAGIVAEGKSNAISNNCRVTLITATPKEEMEGLVAEIEADYKVCFRNTEPDLFIRVNDAETADALNEEMTKKLSFLLHELTFGVQNQEQVLGQIETSVNIGLVETTEEFIKIIISIRSSVAERIREITDRIEGLAVFAGVRTEIGEKNYPAWLPDYGNEFVEKVAVLFEQMYGRRPNIGTVHAGLECGYILKNSNIKNVVALGTNTQFEHTTRERLQIESLNRLCEFVKKVVREL